MAAMTEKIGKKMSGKASTMKYIFYFDINKTIMMSDPGASVPMPAMINSILSECVWGSVMNTEEDSPRWEMSSPIPSKDPPTSDMVSYGEYLENILRVNKADRKHHKTNFTEPGFVGEACREHYLKLLEKMKDLPDSQLIMPSFYNFILELETRRLDYGIVFRTFGSDSTEIAMEYNNFCENAGEVVDTSSSPPLSMKRIDVESAVGKLARGGGNGELETYSLCMGSFSKKNIVIEGCENIYRYIMSVLFEKDMRAIILQDDYEYWHSCGETDSSGKLLIIDPTTENSSVFQVFFDDNVERDRAHIIDARKLPDMDQVTFAEGYDYYYVRVAPFQIITEPNYFINTFDYILQRRDVLHA